MICNIVGGGDSKSLAQPDAFTIGTNFHCEWANIIFAVDEPVLDKLLRKNIDGFTHQLVFTTPKTYPRFRDHPRCHEFDSKKWVKSHSLSSGLNAIVLAHSLGFSTINLYGFSKIISNHRENKIKFEDIRDKHKEYVFI
jgi:hypothetical protein